MKCGEKIAELRKKNGMTQDDLGKAMNVSYQAVSKWERDESQPDFETMSKIAKLFNVPLGYFAEKDGAESEKETEKSDEQPKEEPKEEIKEVKEVKTETVSESVIGTCTVCGKLLKESEVAAYSPKIVCKTCAERQKQEEEKAREEATRDAKYEKEFEVSKIIGHGFDVTLIISLVLALVCYIALTVITFLNQSSDDVFLYGALLFFCPLALFGCTHAVRDAINSWRDFDDDEAYTRDLSLIVGAGFGLVNLAVFLPLHLTSDTGADLYFLILMIMGIVLSFTFVSQFMWNGVVKEIFTAGGFTFKLPGFIITLDIESVIWMIVAKIFLGILAAIVFVITTVLFAAVAILGSIFIFIPAVLWKTGKDHKARKRLKE